MAEYKVYDPKDCVTTIDNSFILSGYASDMITADKDNDLVSFEEGAQGDVVANVSNSTLGTITITLQATSPCNAQMMKYAKNRTVFSIWVANKTLGERMGGTNAMITKYPSFAQGSTVGNRAYTIKVVDFDVDVEE